MASQQEQPRGFDVHLQMVRIDVGQIEGQDQALHLQLGVEMPTPLQTEQGTVMVGAPICRLLCGLDKNSATELGNRLLKEAENLKETAQSNIQIAQNLNDVSQTADKLRHMKGQ